MKTRGIILGLIVLILALDPLESKCFGANYKSLLGTWQVTYRISTSQFTDTFTVTNVSRNGSITGVNEYGDPIHGYVKNANLALISEEGADIYLDSWFFSFKGAKFGLHMGMLSLDHAFDSRYHNPAKAVKVDRFSSAFRVNDYANKEAKKLQKLLECQQLRDQGQ